ncbi:hypothetical protein BRADI_2g16871v3 [Brachypodium distachyon]|uniref:Uncharacterized protein n=1 Tax=Brachypodium distachyon TaxID=15368 RepID=A0A0Q3QTX2_BRADI|nr:hypothetical protein BRADI_2g16871v3 [Brachypodium distachyon]
MLRPPVALGMLPHGAPRPEPLESGGIRRPHDAGLLSASSSVLSSAPIRRPTKVFILQARSS